MSLKSCLTSASAMQILLRGRAFKACSIINQSRRMSELSSAPPCQVLTLRRYGSVLPLAVGPLTQSKDRRRIHSSSFICKGKDTTEEDIEKVTEESPQRDSTLEEREPSKTRLSNIPYTTSIKYLLSNAYKETYGDHNVWELYRRNFSGQFAPKKTRKTCIRKGVVSTGNPCPICRDEYLVLDYRNVKLLQQFISPYNGEILAPTVTGLCRVRHFELLVEIEKAKRFGTITFDVPFRKYDFEEYKKIAERY